MTKADLVEAVYQNVGGFSKKEAREAVEVVFRALKESVSRGDKTKISGFGNFLVRSKNERMGRNPQTGTPLMIASRLVLSFKPSEVLKQRLNPEA